MPAPLFAGWMTAVILGLRDSPTALRRLERAGIAGGFGRARAEGGVELGKIRFDGMHEGFLTEKRRIGQGKALSGT
jgi:hypothetical protein